MFAQKMLSVALFSAFAVTSFPAADANAGTVVRDHRTTKIVVRDHRTKRPNEVVPARKGTRNGVLPGGRKYSCKLGYNRLIHRGYRVLQTNCNGYNYGYRLHKNVGLYDATMSPYSGHITIKFIAFAH